MAEIRAKWIDGMQFVATDSQGHSLVTDAVPQSGGEGAGFKPSELLLVALACCTGMDVVSILRKSRQAVTGFQITVSGEQAAEHPRAFERMHVEYVLRGRGLKEEAVRRAIDLSESKYCSVGATLRGRAAITTSYRIEDEQPPATDAT